MEGDAREKRGRWAGCEAGVGIGASWAAGAGPSERGRSGLGLAGNEKGRAGWAQGKETGQAKRENWAGVLGKGLESWVLLWVPFSILILKQTHMLEFKCEFEFKPQSLN